MSSNLTSLPPEILMSIFHNLPVRDGCQLSACCKQLYEIFQVELIWEQKILKDYGKQIPIRNVFEILMYILAD